MVSDKRKGGEPELTLAVARRRGCQTPDGSDMDQAQGIGEKYYELDEHKLAWLKISRDLTKS